jgi:hypothetical protein
MRTTVILCLSPRVQANIFQESYLCVESNRTRVTVLIERFRISSANVDTVIFEPRVEEVPRAVEIQSRGTLDRRRVPGKKSILSQGTETRKSLVEKESVSEFCATVCVATVSSTADRRARVSQILCSAV